MTKDRVIKRGEIYYVFETNNSVGSEQRSGRPAVIVSNNLNNLHSTVVEVVYMTLQNKTDLPTHLYHKDSTILCEQIFSVSINRLGDYMGRLTDVELDSMDKCLAVSVGLDYLTDRPNPITSPKNFGDIDKLKKEKAELTERVNELLQQIVETKQEMDSMRKAMEHYKQESDLADKYKWAYNNLLETIIGERK